MLLSKSELNKIKGENPEYSERYNQRAFKSKYQSDLIKGIVEIIKNGVDAYLKYYDFRNGPGKIKVILDDTINRRSTLKIINFARGMTSEEFSRALKIGEDTSGTKETVTGAHGYGMKEAAWAFGQARIISVVEGKYSDRIFYWDDKDLPKYAWNKDKDGKDIKGITFNLKKMSELGIYPEGTYFEGIVPEGIHCPSFERLRTQLSNHVLLRAINQSENFDITLEYFDGKSKKPHSHTLKYLPPESYKLREDREEIEKSKFSFDYPGYGIIDCEYNINLCVRELERTGDSREAGILLCSGPYSVLDCTLFDHGDRISSRFFGKAILTGKKLREILKKEKVIDDKREAGILRKTPLWDGLYKHFHPLLERLIDDERKRLNKKISNVEKGILDDKDLLIKEFNKISREEVEDLTDIVGDIKFEPGASGIRFCIPEDYLSLIENQDKRVYLVIAPSLIPIGSEVAIIIKDNKTGLSINPVSFKVTKNEIDKDGIFKKKITFNASTIDAFLVTAFVKGRAEKAELNIESVIDPRLHTKGPLEFIDNPSEIVSGKSKNFSLIVDMSMISSGDKIDIETDKMFLLNNKVNLKDATKIKDDIYELIINIHCSGKPGQKGKLKAIVGNNHAILELSIIDPREKNLRGNFEGIDEDKLEDPIEIGYFDDKIIYICVNHNILKHYWNDIDSKENIAYRVLYADVIIREFCKELARKKIKPFENTTAEDFRVKFDAKYNEFYKKHASRLHRICVNPESLEKLMVNKVNFG